MMFQPVFQPQLCSFSATHVGLALPHLPIKSPLTFHFICYSLPIHFSLPDVLSSLSWNIYLSFQGFLSTLSEKVSPAPWYNKLFPHYGGAFMTTGLHRMWLWWCVLSLILARRPEEARFLFYACWHFHSLTQRFNRDSVNEWSQV